MKWTTYAALKGNELCICGHTYDYHRLYEGQCQGCDDCLGFQVPPLWLAGVEIRLEDALRSTPSGWASAQIAHDGAMLLELCKAQHETLKLGPASWTMEYNAKHDHVRRLWEGK